MPAGLELYRPDGTKYFGLDDHVGKQLGHVDTGGVSTGSVNVPTTYGGTIFYMLINMDAAITDDLGAPTISISGNVLSWSYGSTQSPLNYRIVYGRF